MASPSSPVSGTLVTSLNASDVLFGRGAPLREFIGNQFFRHLIQERKQEYLTTLSHRVKREIAQEIFDTVRARGGRFLQLADGAPAMKNTIKDGVWEEVDYLKALEKVKQALREKISDDGTKREGGGSSEATRQSGGPSLASMPLGELPSRTPLSPGASLSAGMTGQAMVDTRLLLFGMGLPQNAVLNPFQVGVLSGLPQGEHHNITSPTQQVAPTSSSQAPASESLVGQQAKSLLSEDIQAESSAISPSNSESPSESKRAGRYSTTAGSMEDSPSSPDDVSDLELLSSLATKPRFTDEQEAAERAAMTDEARADALCDLFGRCHISTPMIKRARNDLDAESIKFLIKQMRLEIELIPNKEKRSLMEAFSKCRGEEFSDERLEQFLRCEGMNAKLAAQRFVRYWESRREAFGPEKFVMRMTLSEALSDDLAALKTGYCNLLGTKDASGRQLLYWDPSRQTKQGYKSESMLRAIWYTMEVASRENTDPGKHNVFIVWQRNTRLWNYDSKVDDKFVYLSRYCLPSHNVACHPCAVSSLLSRVLKPILWALFDSWTRSRIILHADVSDDQLFEELSNYGIEKDMLPTQMGGTLEFDQLEWIANRRAVELEAI